jgi:8-oxo-dGTP diphosphatase
MKMTEERIKVPRAGVGVMLLNDKGEVLLGKRHEDPEKAQSQLHGEGMWTIPGGKLDFGEDIVKGAIRETREETSIVASDLELISVGNEIVPDAHFVTLGFLARDFVGSARIMEPEEIIEWRWFSLDSLPEPMFPPALKVINNYKNKRIFLE